jgi:hypothetical protein
MTSLTKNLAAPFAAIALGHVTREYPNKLDHTMAGPDDVQSPRSLHPVFYGSFDWHSCVHGYWLLATLYRRFPDLEAATDIRAVFDQHLVPGKIAGELAYLARPESRSFERPYGWAWLLMLAAELLRHNSAEGRAWSAALVPLARAFADRFTAFLPRQPYPIRTAAHPNTAFALALAHEYAEVAGDAPLRQVIADRALAWYGRDANSQAWEPDGDAFLSPALVEAECMRRILPREQFGAWLAAFLPGLALSEPATLFAPAVVSDRTDGKIVHLDGLNLSRAWCWRSIADTLEGAARGIALDAAERHLAASLPYVGSDYYGEHWLASFALLALAFD